MGPLPVYQSKESLSLGELFLLPLTALRTEWSDQPCPIAVAFVVALDPVRLYFGFEAYAQAWTKKDVKDGQFYEGLWEFDVAELFLKEDGTSRYQEFNLGPQGAWWSCVFSGYRKREELSRPANVATNFEISKEKWQVALAIPREKLGVQISFGVHSQANVCAIVDGQKRRHLSWSNISSPEPDFHLASEFANVELRSF